LTWYAIYTAPQRELTLAAMLRRQGYAVCLPVETKMRRPKPQARKRVIVTYPMFGRYLFVKAPIPWLHLMAQRHVSGVVGIDGVPSPIANAEIEKLRQMDGSAIPHRTSVNPHRALRTGDLAEIQTGPFSGQVVKVAGLYGAKARIFVNLFGTVKEAEISVEDLEAA